MVRIVKRIPASGSGGPGEVKVSGADTTSGYLSSELVAGDAITLTILNPAANETLQVASSLGPEISALQSLLAANPIVADAQAVQVEGSGGAVTLTSVPTIAAGRDGQQLVIIGTSDVNLLTVQDDTVLVGSNLKLTTSTNFTLGAGDTLRLVYSTTVGKWVEISRSDN